MNNKQRWVLIIGLVLVLVMALVPPWKETISTNQKVYPVFRGYSLIHFPRAGRGMFPAEIYFEGLVVQWVVVLAAVGIGITVLGRS